jgi:hypothetical protein
LRLTSGTYKEDGVFKLLGEIFVHLLNPAVIWIQIVSAVLIVSPIFRVLFTTELMQAPGLLCRRRLYTCPDLHSSTLQTQCRRERLFLHRRPRRRRPRRVSRTHLRLHGALLIEEK